MLPPLLPNARFSRSLENERADAGQKDGRTRLARPNFQGANGDREKTNIFPVYLTASRIGNLTVDPYSAISDDHTYYTRPDRGAAELLSRETKFSGQEWGELTTSGTGNQTRLVRNLLNAMTNRQVELC